MPKYNVRAKVDQIVTKEVSLLVVANSEEEAMEKAHEALMVYPQPVSVVGVERIVTDKSNYWIPRDVEFRRVEKEEESA